MSELTSRRQLRRGLAAELAATTLGLGLAACEQITSHHDYEVNSQDIAAAKTLAARYTCHILSLHDTGKQPPADEFANWGRLSVVNVAAQLDTRPDTGRYLNPSGSYKDSHLRTMTVPIVTGAVSESTGKGSDTEEFPYAFDLTQKDDPLHRDVSGIVHGQFFAEPHRASTVAEIYVKTHIDALANPDSDNSSGYAVYGTIPCGTAEYSEHGKLVLQHTTSTQLPQVDVLKD